MHQYTFEARLDVDRNGGGARCGSVTAVNHLHCNCHVQDLRRVLPVRAGPPHGGAGAGPPLGAAPRRRGARLERGPQERRHHGQQVGHPANSASEVCQNVPRVCKISARVSAPVPCERQVAAAGHRMLCAQSPLPEHGPPPRARETRTPPRHIRNSARGLSQCLEKVLTRAVPISH